MKSVLAFLLFVACNHPPEATQLVPTHAGAHDHKGAQVHAQLPTHVSLPAGVAEKAKLRTVKVGPRVLAGTILLTGEVVADPDARAIVTARLAGRIVDVRFKENDHVQAGAPLLTIESAELARARADATVTSARAISARANADRVKSIADKGLASGQELLAAKAEAASAEANATAARQTLSAFGAHAIDDAARLVITAPINGRVLFRHAVRGEAIAIDSVVAEIANLDHAYFVARVFEKDLALVHADAAVEVRLTAHPDAIFVARIESIGGAVDPTARTVLCRIRLDNQRDLLKVGLFGTASVATQTGGAERLAVPATAVTDIAGKQVAFVRTADGEFAVHALTIGRSAGGFFEVLSGLDAGEEVVTDGLFSLKSVLLKSSFGDAEQ